MTRETYNNIKNFNGKIYKNNVCYFDNVKTVVSDDDILDMFNFAIEDKAEKFISNNRDKKEIEGILNIINEFKIKLTSEYIKKNSDVNGIYDFLQSFCMLCTKKYFFGEKND